MSGRHQTIELNLREVERRVDAGPGVHLALRTDRGDIVCRHHPLAAAAGGVLWIGGAGGGLDGPADGLYPALAATLLDDGIESLRLDYRQPNVLEECVLDVMLAAWWLAEDRGLPRVAVVGHSFGGAVAITAGALSEHLTAVVALSSQTGGAGLVERLAPKPLLLIHGTEDEVLPATCSLQLHAAAAEPKDLKLYPGCRHGLDECRDEVMADLRAWLRRRLRPLDGAS